MNISSDSTVDLIVSVSDTSSVTERSIGDDDNPESESDDIMSVENGGGVDVNEAVENPSTTEHGGGGGDSVGTMSGAGTTTTSAPAPAIVGGASSATGTSGAIPAAVMHHVTMGVAPGDGDLMPPRFAGDRRTNASEWVRDFTDYVKIRNIPADTAQVLLRNRLTDVARQWFDRLPPDLDLQDVLTRFRVRFGDTDAMRDRLTTDFWGRRQRADEPTENFIEGMASLARRIKLDNPHFLRQAILNGLRPDLQMAVKLQHPTTLEDIAAAAAIAEAGPVSICQPTPTSGTTVTGNPALARPDDAGSVRDLVAVIKELVTAQACPTAAAGHAPGTATAATPTTAGTVTTTSTPAAVPCYVVMQGPAPHNGGHGAPGGRFGRGRGRGWRGPGRGRPTPQNNAVPQQHLDPAAPAYQPAATTFTGQPASSGRPDAVTCQRCGRQHNEGECNALNQVCYNCHNRGHYARCCFTRTQ